jgi:hypothetical protein
MLTPLVPVLLVIHVVLAVALLVPSLLLPFALRANRAAVDSESPAVRGLIGLQAGGTVVIGVGLAITGFALVSAIGVSLLTRPWLLVALTLYALNLVIAFFVQRPRLRPLLGIRSAGNDVVWVARARRQRYLSYVMAAMIGTIGFLMSAKPELW